MSTKLFVLMSRYEIQGAYSMESVDSLLGVFTTRELADAALQAYDYGEMIVVEVELDKTYEYGLN